MIKEEENSMTSLSRTSRSLSSPDSQSSFIDEAEKSRKADSSSDSSEGSTASSLKRKLRNLPSPNDCSPFGDRFAYSHNRIFRKKQDFLYHLQELSNSIEEQDENEVNSASRISSSTLQTPRARRRAKVYETDEKEVHKTSRDLNLRGEIPQFVNQEESDLSQDSSVSDDLSGGRLRFNEIDSEKSSSRSNSPTGEHKFNLYKNESTTQTGRISPSILSGLKTKKIGGYRPNSILVRNLSSESESDTGNEKFSTSNLIMRESEFTRKIKEFSNDYSNVSGINENTGRIDGEFEKFLESLLSKNAQSAYSTPRKKTDQNCDQTFFSAPVSDRSNSSELIRRVAQKRSMEFFETGKNIEDHSSFSVKPINSQGANNNNCKKEISLLHDRKKFEVPTLKLRSQDSLFSASGKNDGEQFQDMKALTSVLSDVSFKEENAFGDSGKFRSIHPECRGSGFSTARNSAVSPGIQIKSLETSHFKNVQGTSRNIVTSRSERFEVKRSANESLEWLNSKNQSHNTLRMETESEIQKPSSSKILQLQTFQNPLFEKIVSSADSPIDEKIESSENRELKKCEIPEIMSEEFSSESFLARNRYRHSKDSKVEIFQRVSSLKLEPISVTKTSTSNNSISPKKVNENLEYSSTSHEGINRRIDQSFCGLEKGTADSVMKCSEEKIASDQQTEAISDESVKMIESCGGDSSRHDQEKWAFQRKIGSRKSSEISEHHESRIVENPPLDNIFQRCSRFNAMKLAKTESTACLKKSSDDPNSSVKNCSSTSKLSFLLDSMKKTQDRCPFTILESETQNSKKDAEEIPMKEIHREPVNKSEENLYKLDTHPSITRLALSGTELVPSELINCVSYEDTPKTRKFLPRVRNFFRQLSSRFTRKSSSKNSAKVLFQNDECRFESIASSGSRDNNKRSSMSSEEADKRHYSLQRFDSETESCRLSEIRSSRARSSPVDIVSRHNRFPRHDHSESEDLENFFAEKTKNEIPRMKKIEEPFVSGITFETRELPCQSAVETSCFCFKMCL